MKILVSGASGFLGSKVVKTLLNKGHKITILTRENIKISDQDSQDIFHFK